MVDVVDVAYTDQRPAGWWIGAEGGELDMRGLPVGRAVLDLLAQCGEQWQRREILEGTIEVLDTVHVGGRRAAFRGPCVRWWRDRATVRGVARCDLCGSRRTVAEVAGDPAARGRGAFCVIACDACGAS